jgi:beta-1,4-mannosyl-glycoprotein beta-1,4-N-acetylglucosaminyltransferase
MNIYDGFMYYDEDLILDLRLNLLNEFVKKFIIVEANYTHSGKKRKLNFDIKNFSKFKNKIQYIVVDTLPKNILKLQISDNEQQTNSKILDNALARENYHRNKISLGLDDCHDHDIIIISDIDEIPNLVNFQHKGKISIFLQKMFYYKFNLKHPTLTWIGSKACKKKDFISPQWLRNIKAKKYNLWRLDILLSKKKYFNLNFIKNGGWHFTSIKKPEDIHYKLSNFLHHLEYEKSGTTLETLTSLINEKKVLYDHNADKKDNRWNASISLIRAEDNELPAYLINNKNKYINFID